MTIKISSDETEEAGIIRKGPTEEEEDGIIQIHGPVAAIVTATVPLFTTKVTITSSLRFPRPQDKEIVTITRVLAVLELKEVIKVDLSRRNRCFQV